LVVDDAVDATFCALIYSFIALRLQKTQHVMMMHDLRISRAVVFCLALACACDLRVAALATTSSSSSNYVLAMQKCAGASEFTLHGLWPVAESCKGKPFSDAPIIDLLPEMKVDWLSCPEKGGDNEGFWSHEWQKHGTCSGLSEHDFFAAALALRAQYAPKCTQDPCRLECDGPTGPCAGIKNASAAVASRGTNSTIKSV
jgi:hypothetical protein